MEEMRDFAAAAAAATLNNPWRQSHIFGEGAKKSCVTHHWSISCSFSSPKENQLLGLFFSSFLGSRWRERKRCKEGKNESLWSCNDVALNGEASLLMEIELRRHPSTDLIIHP